MMAQQLEGPDSNEVDLLTSQFTRACRGHRHTEAIRCAERIVEIYEKNGIEAPALDPFRRFIACGVWSDAT